jgi:hypothetical protein
MSTDLLDRPRSGKRLMSLKKKRMARDVIFCTRDELVYGRLYVTSQMAAVVSNNTRTTLDVRVSCLIRRHACLRLDCFCVFVSYALLLLFAPLPFGNRFDAWLSMVLNLGRINGIGMFLVCCDQNSGTIVGPWMLGSAKRSTFCCVFSSSGIHLIGL